MAATKKNDGQGAREALGEASDAWRLKLWNYAYIASGRKWKPYRALRYIADIVQEAVIKGGGRLIINIPPRHGKSELISHWLPVWLLDWYPQKKIILTSYGDTLAGDYGRIVRDEFHGNDQTWSKIGAKDKATDWRTTYGGGMRTAGIGGPILGFGADVAIIDDPYKNREEAYSETNRRSVEQWFQTTFYSRLEPDATVIMIMQRWHEDDLAGYLMQKHSDKWRQVRLPAIAEEDDELGRRPGEALIPERFNEKTLARIRPGVTSIPWASMFQQRPAPAQGTVILRDWIQYYSAYPPDISRVVVSWDMSFKKEGKSWCVGQAWYRKGSRHWLLAQERGRWGFTTALRKVVAFHNYCTERWGHVKETMIEEAANGVAIINTLRGRLPRVKAITASKSKMERLSNAAPSVENGDVLFPDEKLAPWIDEMVTRLISFPNAADDECDALSQYVNRHKVDRVGGIVLNLDVGVRRDTGSLLQ